METVHFHCDLVSKPTRLPHVWEHCVGSDHAPVALRRDWQAQIARCHEDLGFSYVRFNGLLSDDVGTLVRKDGKLLTSFFNADRIFDDLLEMGMRPFVELSFMPEALASGRKTVFHYRANVTPPKDYKAWARFIGNFVGHLVDRYGKAEVSRWYFEVWNEPNLKSFWTGTQADYFRLYRDTAEAIKNVDASLCLGGPATAKSEWIEEFVAFCERRDVPANFISTHHYPTDDYGDDEESTEIKLSRSQRGIMREMAQDTRRRAGGRPVYYTEWNSSSDARDPLHDESYAAAFAVTTLLQVKDLVQSYSFWTFSDIFEEHALPSAPFHGGFGLMNLHGVPKPVYRAFQLLREIGTEQLLVDGLHETVDCAVIRSDRATPRASGGGGASFTVLLSNHATPGHSIETERIALRIDHAPEPLRASVTRIDAEHVNPKRAWEEMGRPEYLTSKEVEKLQDASSLAEERQTWTCDGGTIRLETTLPPHGVAALTVDLPRP